MYKKMKKLTNSEVVNRIKEIDNGDYEILEEYKNYNTPIMIRHNKQGCGHIWKVRLTNFINKGTRCPECNKSKIMSNEEFKQKLKDKYKDEYVVLEKYKGSSVKIKILHKNCGDITMKRPNDLLSGYGCDKCNKYHKKYEGDFNEELKNIYGDEYIAIESYKGAHIAIYFKHSCGTVFKAKPYLMLQQRRKCPKCKENPTPTEEQLRQMIKDSKYGEDYLLVSNYTKMSKKAKFLHTKCEKTFDMRPTDFIYKNQRCPNCSGVKKYTTETFKNKVLEITEGEYLPLGEYINNKTKIMMKHLECGHLWPVKPNQFLSSGSRCNLCSKSKGNKKIVDYLTKRDISFIAEFRIDKCRRNRTLPFDCAVFDKEKNLKFLVEFQGRQHYEVVEQFGGKKELNERKKNDKIKEQYCKDNNIDLVVIKYTQFDEIENILDKKIQEYNL